MYLFSLQQFRTRAVECLCEVSAELERCKGSQAMFKNLTTRLRNEPMLVSTQV